MGYVVCECVNIALHPVRDSCCSNLLECWLDPWTEGGNGKDEDQDELLAKDVFWNL